MTVRTRSRSRSRVRNISPETARLRAAVAARASQESSPSKSAARASQESSPSKSAASIAHPTHGYEFGGPIGTGFLTLSLPPLLFALYHLGTPDHLIGWNVFEFDFAKAWAGVPSLSQLALGREGAAMFFGWMALQVVLERVLPGDTAEGVELANKTRLSYTISGHLQFWLSLLILFHSCIEFGTDPVSGTLTLKGFSAWPLHLIYTHFQSLMFYSIVFSTLLASYLYLSSFKCGALLAKGGNTGNPIYDFFIGRELNPRIGSLDLKEFCELRPGLIGWVVINLGMAAQQYQTRGFVSGSMALVVLFQAFYVWDALYQERAILTTMDITTDGFGFMLAFGDLSWVPFVYTLQARYLVDHDPNLSLPSLLAISGVHFLGYYIFRAANSQKDAFRRDPTAPEVRHLRFLQTRRGTRLLTSGWWGAARKINYTGDWLVTLAWCLLCGFESPLPYFQAIYFVVLLVHRALRDDHMCREKYGADWDEYKRQVPYMFVPYLF